MTTCQQPQPGQHSGQQQPCGQQSQHVVRLDGFMGMSPVKMATPGAATTIAEGPPRLPGGERVRQGNAHSRADGRIIASSVLIIVNILAVKSFGADAMLVEWKGLE